MREQRPRPGRRSSARSLAAKRAGIGVAANDGHGVAMCQPFPLRWPETRRSRTGPPGRNAAGSPLLTTVATAWQCRRSRRRGGPVARSAGNVCELRLARHCKFVWYVAPASGRDASARSAAVLLRNNVSADGSRSPQPNPPQDPSFIEGRFPGGMSPKRTSGPRHEPRRIYRSSSSGPRRAEPCYTN